MALFHVSHPPLLRLVGVRTSYIYFSNISWTPWALGPITNPFLGPSSWLHPASVGEFSKGWEQLYRTYGLVPYHVRLWDGLCGSQVSPIRLTRCFGLSIIPSSRWGPCGLLFGEPNLTRVCIKYPSQVRPLVLICRQGNPGPWFLLKRRVFF